MRRWGLILLSGMLLAQLLLPRAASAQGSRKDDIVLNRFGQPVAGAAVTVCTSGATGTPCSPLAAVYSDVGLTQSLGNPMSSDGQGNYHFYAAPGRYLVQISGAGVSATTIPDVLLPADPTTPSYQSLTVTQNINAASLNLTGNLSVSGGLSSPTTVSAPEQGSAGPVQVGHSWYPGTASSVCQVPAAPTIATETLASGTGNFSSATAYYVKTTVYNRNGQTTASAATAYTPASGNSNQMLVQLSDWTWRSGCYGYRVYVSSNGMNGNYYPAQAHTLPVASFASLTRGANGVVSAVTHSAHGFIPGESITVLGVAGGATSFNGTFTLIGQQVNSPTTLFWFQSGAAESANPNTGTGTVISGLGADSFGHMAPGDFIVSTVPTSGAPPPASNTAAIDADQVALNATCNYAALACASGHYEVPQGVITGTTPLIVSGQQTLLGDNSGLAGGKSERSCAWADPNLGCVMVMGAANGVWIEGINVLSNGTPLMHTGWGPGYASQNQRLINNTFTTNDTTGQYCGEYFHAGIFYNISEENQLNGSLAALCADAVSGGGWEFRGYGAQRWNVGNLSAQGLYTTGFLSVSSVTDPDRAQIRGAFPNGVGNLVLHDIVLESMTGVCLDAGNMGLFALRVECDDAASAGSGTPAAVRIGSDANNTGGGGFSVYLEDSLLRCPSPCATGVKFTGNTVSWALNLHNAFGNTTNAVDMANFTGIAIYSNGADIFPYENATSNKVINKPANPLIQVFGGYPNDGTTNTQYASWMLKGGVRFSNQANDNSIYLTQPATGQMLWWGGDPATAANNFMQWDMNGTTAQRFRLWTTPGSVTLVDFNNNSGAAQINLCNPSTPANGKISIGCPLVDSTGATVKGALTGTSSNLGGSALAAGNCSNTTVTVSGATTGMTATTSPSTDPGAGFYWLAFVSSSNTVTVRICAAVAGTPTASIYNVRVIQ